MYAICSNNKSSLLLNRLSLTAFITFPNHNGSMAAAAISFAPTTVASALPLFLANLTTEDSPKRIETSMTI